MKDKFLSTSTYVKNEVMNPSKFVYGVHYHVKELSKFGKITLQRELKISSRKFNEENIG